MDALDELDRLADEDDGCKAAPLSSKRAGPPLALSSPRPGKISKSRQLAVRGLAKSKGLSPGKADPSSADLVGDDYTKQNEEEAEKACLGCQRIIGSLSSLIYPEEIVEWAYPDGRGLWCGVCLGCWRTVLRNEVSLVLLGHQLKQADKLAEWTLLLLSYAMLKREGQERITAPMVQERRKNVEWLLGAMGLPKQPSVVVPWVALPSEEREQVHSQDLISIQMGISDFTVGVFVPLSKRLQAPLIARPIVEGKGDQVFAAFSALASASMPLDLPASAGRCSPENDGKPSLAIRDCPGGEDEGQLCSPLGQRLVVAISSCKLVLQVFSTSSWSDCAKEVAFTSPIAKLASIHTEADHNLLKSIVSKAAAWVDLMQRGKTFVKKFREYKKKWAHDRLLDLHPTLSSFLADWKALMSEQVVSSLQALSCKVEFFLKATGENGEAWSLSRAVSYLVSVEIKGMFPHKLFGGEGDEAHLEDWLRGPCLHTVQERVSSLTLEEAEASVKSFYDDVKKAVEVFEKHMSFELLTDDLKAILFVFKPFLSISVSAKDVRMAIKRLQEPRNTKATEIFDQVVGELVKGAADQIIQRSVKDAAGDERFDNACNSLNSDYLPQWCSTSDGHFNLKNFDAIVSGMVFEVLCESMQSVHEAYSMWSAIHAEEHYQEVESWSTKALDLLALVDNALCLWLVQCMGGLAGELNKLADFGSSSEFVTFVSSKRGVEIIGKVGEMPCVNAEHELNDSVFNVALDKLVQAGKNFVKVISTEASSAHWAVWQQQLTVGIRNQEVRKNIVALLSAISQLDASEHPSGSTLLEEWQEQQNTGACNSLLDKMISVVSLAKGIPVESPSITIIGQGGLQLGMTYSVVGDCAVKFNDDVIATLAQPLVGGGLCSNIRACLAQEAKMALDCFCRALELQDLRPENEDDMSDFAEHTVEADIDYHIRFKKDFMDAAKDKIELWMQSEEHALPASHLRDVFAKLIAAVGLSQIDASAMTRGDIGSKPATFLVDDVLSFAVKLERVHEVAMLIAYLRMFLQGGSLADISNKKSPYGLDQLVMVAIAKLSGLLELTMDDDSKDMHELATAGGFELMLQPSQIMSFWERSKASKTKLAEAFFQQAVSGLENLIGDVQKKIPKYSSFLNDMHYHRPMAKKQLLDWPHTDDLAHHILTLFKMGSSIASMRAEWIKMGIELPSLTISAKISETVADGKRAIATISGVRCVQQMAGKVQASEAEKIIKKKDLLPLALHEALCKIVTPKAKGKGKSSSSTA